MRSIILFIIFSVMVSLAQDKGKKSAVSTDTLVSRTQMITKIRSDMDRVQKEAEQTLLILRGQLSALEAQTADSIRVKK